MGTTQEAKLSKILGRIINDQETADRLFGQYESVEELANASTKNLKRISADLISKTKDAVR